MAQAHVTAPTIEIKIDAADKATSSRAFNAGGLRSPRGALEPDDSPNQPRTILMNPWVKETKKDNQSNKCCLCRLLCCCFQPIKRCLR